MARRAARWLASEESYVPPLAPSHACGTSEPPRIVWEVVEGARRREEVVAALCGLGGHDRHLQGVVARVLARIEEEVDVGQRGDAQQQQHEPCFVPHTVLVTRARDVQLRADDLHARQAEPLALGENVGRLERSRALQWFQSALKHGRHSVAAQVRLEERWLGKRFQ